LQLSYLVAISSQSSSTAVSTDSLNYSSTEGEAEAEAEAYCWQPAGTLTPGIGHRWDPWPYIYSMSRPFFFFPPFVDPPY
jgi:hypothetical protein